MLPCPIVFCSDHVPVCALTSVRRRCAGGAFVEGRGASSAGPPLVVGVIVGALGGCVASGMRGDCCIAILAAFIALESVLLV